MIVTCPGCSSKYRVRNESVPADGARMRCPKCETLFLAKPPVDGSSTTDDPSSMYQQLAPQGARGSSGAFPPVPPHPGAIGQPQAIAGVGGRPLGPVTALFAAVDPAPPTSEANPAQWAPPPTPTTPTAGAPAPSSIPAPDGPRMRMVSASATSLRDATAGIAVPSRSQAPTRGAVAASWATLVLGAATFLCGSLTFAWTTEALPLDSALMPVARALCSAERPAGKPLDVDPIRRAAIEASAGKDLPAAVIGWRRVKAQSDAGDRRPSEALAKMLVELGEVP